MPTAAERARIYHITDVENLPSILAEGALLSDAIMAAANPVHIGYGHIKQRRISQIPVPCCGGRFVGEFVPFYFCPRSPMLYTVNIGGTGRPAGCQRTIVHLVSTVGARIGQGRAWAVSDGNAGAFHTTFAADLAAMASLDWAAIRATQWQGRTHQKQAEFLLADRFDWHAIHAIGCHSDVVAAQVEQLLAGVGHRPAVSVERTWYY